MTKTIPFELLANEWRKDPAFMAEYDALEEEFALAGALIRARAAADMSQHDIAAHMGTSQPAVARLEGGKSNPSAQCHAIYPPTTLNARFCTASCTPDPRPT